MSQENRYKLRVLNYTTTDQVNAAATDEIEYKPDAGKVWEIYYLYFNVPAIGGASGNHIQRFEYEDALSHRPLIEVTGANGGAINIQASGLVGTAEQPSGQGDQFRHLMQRLFASNTIPLLNRYTNSSDTNQTGTRTYTLWVKEFREAV